MDKIKINTVDIKKNFFLDYLCFFEAIKTSIKVLHWGITNTEVKSKRGAHKYLDDFGKIVSDYEDMIAETSQGILGNYIAPGNIKGKDIKILNSPNELCIYLLENVTLFYNKLNDVSYVGIKSETETFMKDIQKYIFLFSLCK